ncbi:hypothetical protein BABINDRAFT_32012 [Babjeviella inositovora NRRL Y-12698]|uniref:Vacuolar ATPase assembly integral membrane protein VPH2 n=1 Tax=Babjeviella inositovora NRRL Y-12698 TaxID=984486 RepID=A0A1E3QXN5_9ASCO|nr:uncharacterized protein BABINDRAFT_32012 [Babjeviella inositovora NRRL Y-12698]ODQ81832.1 hypothetical protein BABINDRAFT_32012 [Babjeviella inositovora NRRL Y-12698]
MPKLLVSEQLSTLISQSNLSEDAKEALKTKDYITHSELFEFYKSQSPTPAFADLLKSTSVYKPAKIVEEVPKTKEYLKTMRQLRLRKEEEDYQRLVNPHVSTYDQNSLREDAPLTPAQATKELKSQITTIINILLSVGSVVYAIWYWTNTSWKLNDAYRVLLCLFFGILVLVAEVVVFNGYLTKIDDAKKTERRKKEVKSVVETYEIGKLVYKQK